jgi:glycosyltransferase involved in cell wall biosynthesis
MELGFDAKRLFCNFTGLGNYSRTLLKNLAKYYPEHDFHLYTPGIRHNSDTNPFLEEQTYNVHLPDGRFKKLWRSWSVVNDMQKDRIELFHGLSHEIPLRIRKTGIRSVVSIHDLIFKIYPETYPVLDRKIYDLKFGYACRNADRIIAISESTKRDIIKFYKIDEGRIDVSYQACNPLFYHDKDLEENQKVRAQYKIPEEFILYVGSIEKRKNLKTLLMAIKQLEVSERPMLLVVGRGKKYKMECRQFVEDNGLKPYVFWLDYLWENEHLQSLYQMSLAFVYPSVYEGFGLPVAEALLNKTPVITSNVSSLPEAGGPSSFYVDPLSPGDLANALKNVLGNIELRRKMVSDGYKYACRTFDPKKTTDRVVDIYKKTIGTD